MINGDLLINDHPVIDVIVSERDAKITTIPKNRVSSDFDEAQKRFMTFLSKVGVVDFSLVDGSMSYSGLEVPIPETDEDIDVVKSILYNIDKFMKYEEGQYDSMMSYEDEIEQMLTNPKDDETTELGEVDHDPDKGAAYDSSYFYGGIGLYGFF